MQALVDEQSGPRERVVDEHNFTVPGHLVPGTFRVQLFTSANLRPVAVATQNVGGEGSSLINSAEKYAEAVWRTFLPEHDRPPIWLQRQLLTSMKWFDYQLLGLEPHGEGSSLASEFGAALTFAEAENLVGCPIDPTRGERFAPIPEPAPREKLQYRLAWVAAQPKTNPFRQEKDCMPSRGAWRRRLLRQLAPRPVLDCDCWYHEGDWHAVSRLAIRLHREARRAGVADRDFEDWVLSHPAAEGLAEWQADALESLVSPAIGIDVTRSGYTNGNHRIRAMLDTGVRRTLVFSYRLLPPAEPVPDAATDRRWAADARRVDTAPAPRPRRSRRRTRR